MVHMANIGNEKQRSYEYHNHKATRCSLRKYIFSSIYLLLTQFFASCLYIPLTPLILILASIVSKNIHAIQTYIYIYTKRCRTFNLTFFLVRTNWIMFSCNLLSFLTFYNAFRCVHIRKIYVYGNLTQLNIRLHELLNE